MARRILALGCVLAVLVGCSDFEAASAPPPGDGGRTANASGGSPTPPANEPRDAGGGDTGTTRGGPLESECFEVAEDSVDNDVRTPTDFEVSRVYATWTGDCTSPRLVIGLSEGECPGGSAHELRMEIDALDVLNGVIRPNTPVLLRAEPSGMSPQVRYRRPEERMPSGVWGTCAGVGGDILFGRLGGRGSSWLEAGELVSASFAFELAGCVAETTPQILPVHGSFAVKLDRGFEDVCTR